MPCLMPEDVHGQKRANSAADDSAAQQHSLRDAPFAFYGFNFVNKHKQEGCRINYSKIGQYQFHKFCSFPEG